MPVLPVRPRNPSGASRKRAAGTRIAAPSGASAPSARWMNVSSAICPSLTSGINALPERFDAEPLHHVDEQLGGGTERQIGLGDILGQVGDVAIGHAGPD